ncbi:beta-lactamase/transpeptidase-like protein [Xylaria palmicola]|nr:beta-lactamase/transpeptidase-like protein [Xylaria palmicola]
MLVKTLGFVAACVLSACRAAPTCPLEGPVFPKPLQLARSEAIKAAVANLTSTLKGVTDGAQNYSFALEVFSAHGPAPLFSVLHTAPKLATLNTTGVTTVDKNTVFRLGSLTKIHTIFLFLINAGDGVWNEPITKYVPELLTMTNRSDPVANTAWEKVTIGGLATQMTGIPRDYALLGELTQTPSTRDNVLDYGFPPLSTQEQPPCGDFPTCSRQQFFSGIAQFYPSLPPFTSAAYSNVGFQLLAYALETITGKTFGLLLQDTLIKPLGLNSTFLRAPEHSRGIIPGTPDQTGWSFDLGEAAAAGNIYTSVSDLSAVGRAILDYKLLDPATTKRWLKPFSFSTDPHALVGAPWGARRINVAGQPYRWITAFNKAGRISDYSSVLAIIPDYDIGISVLLAGELPGNANFNLLDIIGEVLIPAVEQAARAEAGAVYSGHYAFGNLTQLNSSMTIGTDDQPGLSVPQWISNRTDFAYLSTALQSGYAPVTPRIRLYPTGLEGPAPDGGKRVVFKAVFEDAAAPSKQTAMFSTDCATWVNVASVIYGSAAMDELIFNVDSQGRVTSVTSPSLRVTLQKQYST